MLLNAAHRTNLLKIKAGFVFLLSFEAKFSRLFPLFGILIYKYVLFYRTQLNYFNMKTLHVLLLNYFCWINLARNFTKLHQLRIVFFYNFYLFNVIMYLFIFMLLFIYLFFKPIT